MTPTVLRRLSLTLISIVGVVWADAAAARTRYRPIYREPPVAVRGGGVPPRGRWADPGLPPGTITATTPNAAGNFGGPGTGGGGGGGP